MTTARHSATSTASISSAAALCPTNQQLGEKLDTLTVKAMLAVPLTAVSSNAGYCFCPAPDCPTVYYRADGQQVFDETDVRERIYQKHADDPHGIICYCFGFTVGDVRAEYARGRANTIVEQIQNGVQAGQCACDIRNPQGRCCLGNVRNLIDRLMDPARNTEAHNV